MAHEYFEKYKPAKDTMILLHHIVSIVHEYEAQGLTLTLRQLYYQLVSKDLIANEEKQYKRVGNIVSRARRGGLLDWDSLEDRVRRPQDVMEFRDLHHLLRAAFNSYRLARHEGQERYVELWVEKDALAGVLAPIAHEYHITLMVNRGYSSTSAMKSAGDRIRNRCSRMEVSNCTILYLGDLDPSGEDMLRDVQERLDEYTNMGILLERVGGKLTAESDAAREVRKGNYIDVTVEKLALTMDQVDEHNPPPNPAKTTDSRFDKFSEKFGDESWEVDALPPAVLRDIITERLEELIDMDKIENIKDREERDKELLEKAVETMLKSDKKNKRK